MRLQQRQETSSGHFNTLIDEQRVKVKLTAVLALLLEKNNNGLIELCPHAFKLAMTINLLINGFARAESLTC